MLRATVALVLAVLFASPCQADLHDLMKTKGRKVLFLGDSNTYSGLYIGYVEGYLRTRFPEEPWDLINLGLPSETLSGLSEPDHPYPRPDVHERAERALTKIKPNIVFVCYGMNDGIYHPFSEDRLKKYKEGTEKLVAKIEKAGAKVILMTPAPFDGTPIAKNLLPKDSPKFSWMKPYEKYDAEVLRKYSDYLLEWRSKGYTVVDAHSAVHRFLKKMREVEPKYIVSGDGIHPNATGHTVIAFEILLELKAPADIEFAEIDFAKVKVLKGSGKITEHGRDFLFIHLPGKLPMPMSSQWNKRLAAIEKHPETLNRHTFKVVGLPAGKYEIRHEMKIAGSPDVVEDQVLRLATHAELADGVSFFIPSSSVAWSSRIGDSIALRHRVLGPAWLSEIGYQRPGTPKGRPLDEAIKQAEEIERDIHKLSPPRPFDIVIRKKGD